jgi:hypothetical protein
MHVTLDAGDIEEVRVTASSAEVVVVVDLPPCFAALDDILVPASDSQGPSVIYMLHMNGGMDDRLAVIASIRATTARFAGNKPYTTREIDYLLGDIHLEEVLA